MGFIQPETDDERRTELLRLMGVSGQRGVYVLGCFASYVTVYSQQVRALNLVDSLAKSGVLSHRSRVAVIGGGIAGLTAAAAAAVRGVKLSKVFEKLANTMRLQRGTDKRYIHPHIYDWPDQIDRDDADLPLMTWRAGHASDVVSQLDSEWNEIRSKLADRLPEPQFCCTSIGVNGLGRKPLVTVNEGGSQEFDVVILAIGFGRDATKETHAYWTDTSIDSLDVESSTMIDAPHRIWFVSHCGDGALTDLMRLCIMDFQHGKVIKEVHEATRDRVGRQLKDADSRNTSIEERIKVYEEAARSIEEQLDRILPLRSVGKIWLNCTKEELFSPKASVLNRLIIALLHRKQKFDFLPDAGQIEEPVATTEGRYQIRFKGGRREPIAVTDVIIRHGPDRPLETDFKEIWEACAKVREEWTSARQHEDWTKKPMYSREDFDFELGKVPDHRDRVDFGGKVGCVLVTGSKTLSGQSQEERVKQALQRFSGKDGKRGRAILGADIETKPVHIPAIQALFIGGLRADRPRSANARSRYLTSASSKVRSCYSSGSGWRFAAASRLHS